EPGERVQLSFRITPELKRRLDETADASGRSQSQEAEFRLERSFARADLLVNALYLRYSREAAGIILAVSEVMNIVSATSMGLGRRIEARTSDNAFDFAEQRWAAFPASLEAALVAGIAVLAMLRPEEAELVTPQHRRLAIETGAGFLQALVKAHKDEPAYFR